MSGDLYASRNSICARVVGMVQHVTVDIRIALVAWCLMSSVAWAQPSIQLSIPSVGTASIQMFIGTGTVIQGTASGGTVNNSMSFGSTTFSVWSSSSDYSLWNPASYVSSSSYATLQDFGTYCAGSANLYRDWAQNGSVQYPLDVNSWSVLYVYGQPTIAVNFAGTEFELFESVVPGGNGPYVHKFLSDPAGVGTYSAECGLGSGVAGGVELFSAIPVGAAIPSTMASPTSSPSGTTQPTSQGSWMQDVHDPLLTMTGTMIHDTAGTAIPEGLLITQLSTGPDGAGTLYPADSSAALALFEDLVGAHVGTAIFSSGSSAIGNGIADGLDGPAMIGNVFSAWDYATTTFGPLLAWMKILNDALLLLACAGSCWYMVIWGIGARGPDVAVPPILETS